MEEMQLVTSQMTTSPHGPKRKTYYLSKSLTVALDIAPNLYSEHITSFNTPPSKHQISDTSSNLIGNINQIKEAPQQGTQITSFENLISHIDQEIEKLENERTILLYIRNAAMKEATKIIKELDRSEDEKKVLHCILDEHSINIADISESLNLREAKVREIMTELKKDLLTP